TTDFALRTTKVTARSLGQVLSTMVVQERHRWLNLAQRADVDKVRFLNAPVSQVGLFGDTVEDFAQQFSAIQRQTEAIKPNLHLPVAEGALLRLLHRASSAPRRRAPRRRAAPPVTQGTTKPTRKSARRP
ncbi:MAG: hypothetical protein ACRC0L_11735, partial [Angustibacter sp.]